MHGIAPPLTFLLPPVTMDLHVRTLDALVGEYDCEQDTDDEMPGLGYSSGEDSDMDMGEEMGEEMGVEMGEAVDMGEGMGEAVVYQLTMVYQLTYTVLALLALLL